MNSFMAYCFAHWRFWPRHSGSIDKDRVFSGTFISGGRYDPLFIFL